MNVSDEQLHALNQDEKSGMLFYLAGFLAKSEEFQDALTRAYNAQMRSRERSEARAEYEQQWWQATGTSGGLKPPLTPITRTNPHKDSK